MPVAQGWILVDQLECVQGQIGLGSEQPGIVGVSSTPARELELDDLLGFPQIIL